MLEIENLSVEYFRKGRTLTAVRNFSLSIERGETVGLVGESGSGKSTVALAILRLIRPQEGRILEGRIRFQGKDLLPLPEESMNAVRGKKISMIFQDPFTALNPVMRIQEQMLEMGAGLAKAQEGLSRVQLEPTRTLNAYPHQLSGGQRQRVMIAMALLNRPDLLLADEPTTALDVLVQKEILDLLFRLQKELGLAILFVSHNLGLVAHYTNRMAVMKDGALVEAGTPQRLFQKPETAYTRSLIAALPTLTMTRRRGDV